ncbi:hypothetical protein IFM89_000195 [Coptis chinensis]|uniref:F-box associated beta-propeller type 1 domain-containing protein n=1 Tax=Coptis chinensis TaxID=261450 RepID=A0A835I9Y6_9MAGN|nr:hypothetical protein IFM89_000195 [Coptis chinensis]
MLRDDTRLFSLDYEETTTDLAVEIDHPVLKNCSKIWGSCNGFVCTMSSADTLSLCRLLALNEYKNVPPFEQEHRNSVYGFGYNSNTDDYEVVRVGLKQHTKYKYHYVVAVYSLREESWRKTSSMVLFIG